jgi:hypothetical protein
MNLHRYRGPDFSKTWAEMELSLKDLKNRMERDLTRERPGTIAHRVMSDTISDLDFLLSIPDETKMIVVLDRASGFFSLVLVALSYFAYSEKKGFKTTVHWGDECLYCTKGNGSEGENIWNNFFQPLATPSPIHRFPDGDLESKSKGGDFPGDGVLVARRNPAMLLSPGRIDEYNRGFLAGIVRKHFTPIPGISAVVHSFASRYFAGHHVIGVHVRGNEHDGELGYFRLRRRPLQSYFDAVSRAGDLGEARIFLATDQQDIVQAFRERYGQRLLLSAARRVNRGESLHGAVGGHDVGVDVLIECLLLSRCNHLVHGISNVSTAACYFNALLPHACVYETEWWRARIAYETVLAWCTLVHSMRVVKARLHRILSRRIFGRA